MGKLRLALLGLAALSLLLAMLPITLGHASWTCLTLAAMMLLWAGEIQYWNQRVERRRREKPTRFDNSTIRPASVNFLDTVDHLLGLPAHLRLEIRAELAAHLADSIGGLRDEGLAEEAAERAAIARLGRPEELARQLRRAHQTTERLLAGAAGGVWSAGVGVVQGYLLVVGLVLVGLDLAFVIWQKPLEPVMGLWTPPSNFGSYDAAVGTATAGFLAWLPIFLAGRRCVAASSLVSRRHADRLTWAWALAGGSALLWLVLCGLSMAQSWLAVPALLGVPFMFVAGSLVEAGRIPGSRRGHRAAAVVAVIVVVGSSFFLGSGVRSYSTGSKPPTEQTYASYGYDRLGMRAIVTCSSSNPGPTVTEHGGGCVVISGISTDPGFNEMSDDPHRYEGWGVADPAALSGFADLRAEFWRAVPSRPWDAWMALDTRRNEPYLSVPATVRGDIVILDADLHGSRNGYWIAVVTGQGADGRRYVLSFPESIQTTFSGTVWDWLTASD